jgi:hypothetical protein
MISNADMHDFDAALDPAPGRQTDELQLRLNSKIFKVLMRLRIRFQQKL